MTSRDRKPRQPSWGRFIQEVRESRGFTIRQAALLAGVSDSYWGQVERGYQLTKGVYRTIAPSRPMLIAMAETLRLTPKDTNRLLDLAGLAPVQDADQRGADPAAMVDLTGLSRRDVVLLNALADRLREAPSGVAAAPVRRVARRPGTPRQGEAGER